MKFLSPARPAILVVTFAPNTHGVDTTLPHWSETPRGLRGLPIF